MNSPVSRAVTPAALRQRLEEAKAAGYGMGAVSVLSARRDPYRLDTPAMHRDGAWPRECIGRLGARLPIHLRGLHYVLVAKGGVLKPDGKPYVNDDENWIWLSEVAAKAARWLGYLGFDQIIDNRNYAPAIYVPHHVEPEWRISYGIDVALPDPEDVVPTLRLQGLVARQPWRLVLAGEKASLAAVLGPLARRYCAELVLPTGEMSDTLVHGIAHRAATDGRPAVVLYFADADPAGWQMPVSVARKLQAFAGPDAGLEVEVRPGPADARAGRRARPAEHAAEGDRAAGGGGCAGSGASRPRSTRSAALRPEELRRIAVEAMEPFFDRDLDRRVGSCRQPRGRGERASGRPVRGAAPWAEIRAQGDARLAELREKVGRLNEGPGGRRRRARPRPARPRTRPRRWRPARPRRRSSRPWTTGSRPAASSRPRRTTRARRKRVAHRDREMTHADDVLRERLAPAFAGGAARPGARAIPGAPRAAVRRPATPLHLMPPAFNTERVLERWTRPLAVHLEGVRDMSDDAEYPDDEAAVYDVAALHPLEQLVSRAATRAAPG